MNWAELAHEFPVLKCDFARFVNLGRVLVVLTYLKDTARLVPFVGGEVLSDSTRGLSPLPRVLGGVSCTLPKFQLCARGVCAMIPPCFQCITPSPMRSEFPGDNRDEIACRAAEDIHCGNIFVSGSGVLRYCTILYCSIAYLNSVSVQFSLWTGVVGDESFHRLASNLCTTIAVRGRHRRYAVMYAPSVQESPGLGRGELRTPGRCEFFWRPVGLRHERAT